MMLAQTILAFIVALGLLVTIHELGHYLVARWCGVKILKFSVGMGRQIFSRKFGADQTEWVISVLPLGGYVKMLDAREMDDGQIAAADMSREFSGQVVWKRIAIVIAGPLANFLLAIALFTGLYLHGVEEPASKVRVPDQHSVAYQSGMRHGDRVIAVNQDKVSSWNELRWKLLQLALAKSNAELTVERVVPASVNNPESESETPTSLSRQNSDAQASLKQTVVFELPLKQLSSAELEADFMQHLGFSVARPPALLQAVVANGPADRAGLLVGDQILAVNGESLIDGLQLTTLISKSAGMPLELLVKRAQKELNFEIIPEVTEQNGVSAGRIKVQLMLTPEMVQLSYTPLEALQLGLQKTWSTSLMNFQMIGKMLTGDVSLKNVTGPITIADYAGQTSRTSMISYLSFIALISISLGVMNLLPIPVLDGGHLLYYSLEVLTGKPVPEKFSAIAQRIGIALLMSLMLLAFFNDIVRLMS